MKTTISFTTRNAPISEHPAFHEKRSEWGVVPAHNSPIYDEYGCECGSEWIPENRSKHRPELDGMSLAEMWDYEKQDWRIQPPGFDGITTFLKAEKIETKEPTTRKELALMVPNGGLMIELGVAAGKFAEELLDTNHSARYVGIDRWNDHHDTREMDNAKSRIARFGDRADVFRLSFAEARISFPQPPADLVYIDGYAHTGQEGGQTLRDWWTAVKPGGIFAGHDYDAEYPLTVKVVDEFVAEHGLELNVIAEKPNSSWWVRKPLS